MAELVRVEGWRYPEPKAQLGAPNSDRGHGGTWFKTGVVCVMNFSRTGHWSELEKYTVACPDSRYPTEPASEAGTEGELRGEVVDQDSEGLPEAGGVFEPGGSSYRGQNSVTGWVFLEGTGRRAKQLSHEPGVLLLWRAETLFEQCGVCHTLDFRHGVHAVNLMKLKAQVNADWAW